MATTSASAAPQVHVLGVRHHGPGSARAVVAKLCSLQPDVVLLEGPADADPLASHAAASALVPPVAMLAYSADEPRLAGFWPMAQFSPEWQALEWAAHNGCPVRFCDLPSGNLLALQKGNADPDDAETAPAQPDQRRSDPIAMLAYAAGHDDPERWWDDVVESGPAQDPFEVIAEAMAALRESAQLGDPDLLEQQREAQMRQVLRTEIKAGRERIAVVCGAWHAPALAQPLPPAARDARLLRGMAKVKTNLTWIPWTHSRLASSSGYGAGVTSPGWYAHLFATTKNVEADWLTRVAASLRRHDIPTSTANVIEATRLAFALAVLRGRPSAGLSEVTDATLAVLCDGSALLLDLVNREMVVGESLGQVPPDSPTVPLEQDLASMTRRLRLKRDAATSVKELDLRKANDLARSHLLHRLNLLGIGWGTLLGNQTRNTGTFRETWQLDWPPEMAVDVIDASIWGTTVESGAVSKVLSDALGANLSGLTRLVEACLLADLAMAIPDLVHALEVRAAKDHDVIDLMQALPPLVRSLRYSDVRATDVGGLATVCDGLVIRICAGIPSAIGSLDDDGAHLMRQAIDGVHSAIALRDDEESAGRWSSALRSVVDRADVHGLLAGRITRLLCDAGSFTADQGGARLARALSIGSEPSAKAAWVEGFLDGAGLMLVHDPALLSILDDWVTQLRDDDFADVVPLLRRTFGQMAPGERQAIGDQVRRLRDPTAVPQEWPASYDVERAAAALATVSRLLGLSGPS